MAGTTIQHAAALALAAVCALGAAGCGGAGAREAREENHPLMRRALARKRANDFEGAIAAYQEALERNPALARAHLDLGLLYDQGPKKDPLRALYHYQRYLELRPSADKRAMVEGLIRDARISFAAAMRPPPAEAYETIAALQRENERLRGELERSRGGSAAVAVERPAPPSRAPARSEPPAPPPETAAATPLPPPPPAPPARAATTYVVQPGDTLAGIAQKVYGDRNAWPRIAEANRSTLPDPSRMKVGTTLTIPRP